MLPRNAPARRGLTLLEMLIVLAIIVSMATLSAPALRKPFVKAQLRDAARLIRTELAKARLAAIESGVPQAFRFQPGTSLFEIKPLEEQSGGEGPAYSESLAASIQSNQSDMPGAADPLDPSLWQRALPHAVCFYAQQVAETSADEVDSALAEPEGETLDAEASWSPPIVFYPNGRTTNARVRLTNGRDYAIDVMLRGITGTAMVGRVEKITAEIADPEQAMIAASEAEAQAAATESMP